MKYFRQGDKGPQIVDIQSRLASLGLDLGIDGIDGFFGDHTTLAAKAFQQKRGIVSDGIVGPNTWRELVEASFGLGDRLLYLREPNVRGDDVLNLQRWMNSLGFDAGPEDGIFGPVTDQALRELQRNAGVPIDGIVGGETLNTIEKLMGSLKINKRVKKPDRNGGFVYPKSDLKGRTVAVDPGHGGGETGLRGPTGSVEAEINYRISINLSDELIARGAIPIMMRGEEQTLSVYERVMRANQLQVEVYVAIHLNGTSSTTAQGCSTYYFANGVYYSEPGKKLANSVQDSILSLLPLKDDRCHGVNYALLRETKMPAIQIEPVFITNPVEEEMINSVDNINKVAKGITEGIEAFFGRMIRIREKGPSSAD